METSGIVPVLQSCDLFRDLEKSHIEKIAGLCHMEDYGLGQYIFQQGDPGENLYVISQGNVFLERSIDLGTRKGNAVIGILGKGKAFGCWSTLLDIPHDLMTSAVCKSATNVVVMSGQDLRKTVLTDPELGLSVYIKLCCILRERLQSAYGAMEKI